MALSLFVAVDNNYKTRIVIQALIKYETQADYDWILNCTLQASNNHSSKVLFTNEDPAMITAVQSIYTQTRHLLCIYHLLENIKKKVKSQLQGDNIKNFMLDFYIIRNNY